MRQKLHYFLFFFIILFSVKSYAAGGPDAYGYIWKTSLDAGGPTYNWIDITSYPGVQTVSGLADDNSAASMINLGFNFHYYWADYSQLKVGSNGWLGFNNISNIASCFPTIPSIGGAGDNYLAPLMSDLNFTGIGNIGSVKYWSNNIDTFIISYIDVPFWNVNAPGWAGSNTFQVILSAADSSITFQYGVLSGFNNGGGCIDLTVGIENSTGNIGLQVHSDALPPQNYAIRFEYPAVPLISIQDITPRWNDNSGNKAQFIIKNTSKTLKTNYFNSGNADVNTTIDLQTTILDAASATVYNSTGSLPSLAAGDDSTVTATPDWTPTATGQYTFHSTSSNADDINPNNNFLDTEIEVVDICQSNMTVTYVSGNTAESMLNWDGVNNDDDGAGVYFIPPVAPYDVTSMEFFINSNVSDYFIANIYDDNGPNGLPGTLLYTQTVTAGSIVTGAWNAITLTAPITINDGGFYVVWIQGGNNISLGSENSGPASRLNYELMNGGWAEYRYTGQDLMIKANINNYNSAPSAAFNATAGPGNIQFTDQSSGPEVNGWLWDFGDGNISTQQNPIHTYSTSGNYTVCLTATNICSTDSSCQTIVFCALTNADYSYSANDLSINFSDLSSGDTQAWSWDFGDGNTSTQQNPTHTYATTGTYTICLITTDGCGNADTTCQSVTICSNPGAAFAPNATGLDVDFNDLSLGTVDNWSWDFGDGNTSTSQNPSYTYAAAGQYTVCLIVSNSCGIADTICAPILICAPLSAGFNYSANDAVVGFTDNSGGAAESWSWDFGDGNTSTAQNPTHDFVTAGNYDVCLVVYNNCNESDTTCQTITVTTNGLNEQETLQLAVWPNPTETSLTVSVTKPMQNATITITDLSGRIVWTSNSFNGTTFKLDISELTSGFYQLQVLQNGYSGNIKFLKR